MKSLDKNVPINFHQITDNIYRSALPNTKHLQFLKSAIGLTDVIDLGLKPRDHIRKFCEKNTLSYHKFFMSSDVVDLIQIKDILDLIDSLSDKTILIHCFHGKHRTGLISSLLLKQLGYPTKAILQQLFLYGFNDPLKHWNLFEYILEVC